VNIPATVPQGSEIPEGLMNNPVYGIRWKFLLYIKNMGSQVQLAQNTGSFEHDVEGSGF
jgi:hypothetical protein